MPCNCENIHSKRLIDRLYYKTRTLIDGVYQYNGNDVNYLTDRNEGYAGSGIYIMCDSSYRPIKNTKIYFEGVRFPPLIESGFDQPHYREKLLLQNNYGEIEASTIYIDSGTGAETTVDSVDYYVNHATKKYKNATTVRITYDNEGLKSGVKYSRVVKIY